MIVVFVGTISVMHGLGALELLYKQNLVGFFANMLIPIWGAIWHRGWRGLA